MQPDLVAAERRIFAEELAAATPCLIGRSIPERLEIARHVEARVRWRVEQLNPVPAIPTT
jgi:uncharacterized membrane protein